MQIAIGIAAGIVGRELHGTDAGAHLTLHTTGVVHMHRGEMLRQRRAAGSHPRGDGAHGTEGTPRAGSVDEVEHHTDNSGDEDDGPEHTAYVAPHGKASLAPAGLTELQTEHGEDKYHHEDAETFRAHETRYGTVGGIAREQTVVHIAARTDVAAPVSAATQGRHHGTHHADDGNETHDGIEPRENEVDEKYPVEGRAGSGKVAMEGFL